MSILCRKRSNIWLTGYLDKNISSGYRNLSAGGGPVIREIFGPAWRAIFLWPVSASLGFNTEFCQLFLYFYNIFIFLHTQREVAILDLSIVSAWGILLWKLYQIVQFRELDQIVQFIEHNQIIQFNELYYSSFNFTKLYNLMNIC